MIAGCVGNIGDSPVGGGTGQPDDGAFTPGPATIHVLTETQLQNAYVAAFGDPLDVALDLPKDDQLYGFTSIAAANRTISIVDAEKYQTAAYVVIDYVWQDPARREALVGCPASSMADPCVEFFVERFGRQVWRRPLEDAEVQQLLDVGRGVEDDEGDTWDALRYVVATLLQSPHFLFRVEHGVPDPATGWQRFTGWEMASRLSFILTDAPPDEELLDAAESGALDTAEGVRAQATRLVEDARARPALVRFFRDFMSIGRLDELDKSAEMFPMFTTTLGAAMRLEIEKMFEHKVFAEGGDFRELFTTRQTFVDRQLAEIYGIPGITFEEMIPWNLPDDGKRAGVLTTAGFLAMNAHKTATSPTHRGRFVRVNLLCQDIPPPPPGVDTTLEPNTGGAMTLRDQLEEHRTNPACTSCHEMMDPIGFAFEHYDAIGAWRDLDNGLPVDATSEVEGTPVDGALQMGELVASLPEVGSCIARRFYQHANGRLDEPGEDAGIRRLVEGFVAADHDFKQLVLGMVSHDGFRFAKQQEEE